MNERIRHDEVRFRAILSSIDVPADGDFKPIRIGNENVRARLIKIVFMDPSMVSKCMRQKSKLKGSNIKQILKRFMNYIIDKVMERMIWLCILKMASH